MDERSRAEIAQLWARIGTLEQLLEVYESSVLEQSDKLYTEQERMRFQKTLLECQGEASLDGILSVSVDGRILFANRRLSEMWGVAPPIIGTKSSEQVLRSMAERTSDPARFLERTTRVQKGGKSAARRSPSATGEPSIATPPPSEARRAKDWAGCGTSATSRRSRRSAG